MLINLFSIRGFTGLTDTVQCNLDVEKKDKTVQQKFTTSSKIEKDAFKAYCVFDLIAPKEWTPGEYSVKPWLKAEANKVVTKGDKFNFTIQPYQPNIQMFSWIVSPIKLKSLEGFGDLQDQRTILLANALPFANKGDRVGLLAGLEATGFPPSSDPDGKHKIDYSFSLQDSKGTNVKISNNTKMDDINGMLQLYHPLSLSEKLAPGPIVVTAEITIDNIKSQAQNGFVIH